MMKYIKKQDGFTLIEIMVSIAISSLVIAGVYGVYTIQQRSYTVQEQVAEMQQRLRAAVNFMSREVRMAGYNPPAPYDPSNACDDAEITQADAQTFAFSYCDVTANTSTTPVSYTSVLRRSTYQLDNKGVLGLLRDNAVTPMPVAEGINAVEFRYLGQGGAVLAAPVDRTAIRAVQISMLVRSTYPDMKHTDKMLYLPRSMDKTWNGTFNANPPNDNFHRRLLITTVYLRNMGL